MIDLFMWKLVPSRFGGGKGYIQRFKDAWVRHNRHFIHAAATENRLPVELLAGVCWIEVGGDPGFIDRVAFEVRAYDWSGPPFMDQHLTVTNPPERTSFGAVSIQLRTAVDTLGWNLSEMSNGQLRQLAGCLENDVFNIDLAARHLRKLVERDKFSVPLTMEQVRIVGTRYNRGTGLSLESIRKNTSYGSFIVNHWPRFQRLVHSGSYGRFHG